MDTAAVSGVPAGSDMDVSDDDGSVAMDDALAPDQAAPNTGGAEPSILDAIAMEESINSDAGQIDTDAMIKRAQARFDAAAAAKTAEDADATTEPTKSSTPRGPKKLKEPPKGAGPTRQEMLGGGDSNSVTLEVGKWQDFSLKLMSERIAKAHCANLTGNLAYSEGAKPRLDPETGKQLNLTPIDCYGDGVLGFVDNFVLWCLVPYYQVSIPDPTDKNPHPDFRSQEYDLLNVRTVIIRHILEEAGIVYESVEPARMFDIDKVPPKMPNRADHIRIPDLKYINDKTVPQLKNMQTDSPLPWHKQFIIIHTPNAPIQKVADPVV